MNKFFLSLTLAFFAAAEANDVDKQPSEFVQTEPLLSLDGMDEEGMGGERRVLDSLAWTYDGESHLNLSKWLGANSTTKIVPVDSSSRFAILMQTNPQGGKNSSLAYQDVPLAAPIHLPQQHQDTILSFIYGGQDNLVLPTDAEQQHQLIPKQDVERTQEAIKRDFLLQSEAPPESLLQDQTSEENNVRIILAPFHRTILSAQISTPILSSQVSASVKKIYKHMGESFKKGDPLVEIDRSVFYANLLKSKALLDHAIVVLDARQKLFADAIASLTELKEAQANVANANAELVLAQTQYDAALVTAPYDGRVATVLIEEDELPQPGQALIEIIEDKQILVKALVPAEYLSKLAIGKKIDVHLRELDKNVVAKIIRVGAVIDPSSETVAIDALLDNSEGIYMPGMTGYTTIK